MTEGVEKTQAKLSVAVSRVDSVFTKVNSGQGSLGLLVNDPRLYRNSDSLITELRSLVSDVRQNPRRYINVRVF
jgi:phospholipid/cholesterol/gamma-HCH transport system substrate-binding protein